MTVRNGAPHIREAINSILAQTDPAFELIIIDDGSTDETAEVIGTYDDPRLVSVRSEPIGRVAALQKAMSVARGGLIAILDADDIAMPHRLATQREFLAVNPDVALVGSSAIEFDEKHEWRRRHISGRESVRRALAMHNPYYHSSIMFRRTAYDAAGGYRSDGGWGHDKDLLLRFALRGPVDIIDEPLIRYRQHAANWSRRADDEGLRLRKSSTLQLRAARALELPAVYWIYPLSAWVYARIPAPLKPRRWKEPVKRALIRILRVAK